MRVAKALTCGLLISFAAAVSAPAAHSAAPVGLIKEIPLHGNAGGIAAGPEGDLWFTQNLPVKGGLAIGRITPGGKVTRFKRGLTSATQPLEITAGPDGNMWFTYDPGISSMSGGGIGRITPAGQITLFPEPPDLHGSPFEIVAGPDGNLWFTHAAILTPTGQAIGRITPGGEITEFFAGLSEKAEVANLTPGPGGVWFADESSTPAIGRITPSGEITEFPGLRPHEFPIVYGPTPGPEGNLWFAGNARTSPAVERITPSGTIERFTAGIDRRTEYVGPFAVGADGNTWFRIEKQPRGQSFAGSTAIDRITPGGQIAEFSDCLRTMPQFAGPNFLTHGPDGNVWFTTWSSEPRLDPVDRPHRSERRDHRIPPRPPPEQPARRTGLRRRAPLVHRPRNGGDRHDRSAPQGTEHVPGDLGQETDARPAGCPAARGAPGAGQARRAREQGAEHARGRLRLRNGEHPGDPDPAAGRSAASARGIAARQRPPHLHPARRLAVQPTRKGGATGGLGRAAEPLRRFPMRHRRCAEAPSPRVRNPAGGALPASAPRCANARSPGNPAIGSSRGRRGASGTRPRGRGPRSLRRGHRRGLKASRFSIVTGPSSIRPVRSANPSSFGGSGVIWPSIGAIMPLCGPAAFSPWACGFSRMTGREGKVKIERNEA